MDRSILHEAQLAAGAKFIAGGSSPLQYAGGALKEHLLLRRSAALADLSPCSVFAVAGPGAASWLEGLQSLALGGLGAGSSAPSLFLSSSGEVVDLARLCRLAEDSFLIVSSPGRGAALSRALAGAPPEVELGDRSAELLPLLIAGPRSLALLEGLSGGVVSPLSPGSLVELSLFGGGCTCLSWCPCGEAGFLLLCPIASASAVWSGLLDAAAASGVEAGPAGTAALASVAMETGAPLWGLGLGEGVDPREAGFLPPGGRDFAGLGALLGRGDGKGRKVVTITVKAGLPDRGSQVKSLGKSVGPVLGGCFCPSAKLFACRALLDAASAGKGNPVMAEVEGREKEGRVAVPPLA